MKEAHKLTPVEWLIMLMIVAIILRFVFAGELRAYENRLLAAIGIGERAKLFLLVPLAAGALYLNHRRDKYADTVPTWLIGLAASIVVALIGAIAWLRLAQS